jgi:hypothetical protein
MITSVTCRRCKRAYVLSTLTEKFTFWICRKREDKGWCMTFNIWR